MEFAKIGWNQPYFFRCPAVFPAWPKCCLQVSFLLCKQLSHNSRWQQAEKHFLTASMLFQLSCFKYSSSAAASVSYLSCSAVTRLLNHKQWPFIWQTKTCGATFTNAESKWYWIEVWQEEIATQPCRDLFWQIIQNLTQRFYMFLQFLNKKMLFSDIKDERPVSQVIQGSQQRWVTQTKWVSDFPFTWEPN